MLRAVYMLVEARVLRKVYCLELRNFVDVPENVRSIASLTPSITATLIEMGLGNLIVGISPWCRVLELYGYPVPRVPIVGSYERVDKELLFRTKPDLVLISGGYQVKILSELRMLGLPTYVVRLPRGLEFVELPIELGYVLNKLDRGFEVFRRSIEDLCLCKAVVERTGLGKRITALAMVIGNELVVPGAATHVTQLAEACGVNCVNRELGFSYVWGDEAKRLLSRYSTSAELLLIQSPSPRPRVEDVSNFVDLSTFSTIVVLPVLSLSDYSPSSIARFAKITEIAVKSLGSVRVVQPHELRVKRRWPTP